MISPALARELRTAGLRWEPAQGDRFVVEQPEMEHEVFVLSDMTVTVHEFVDARVLGFNGTVEWALDSVDAGQALWLPAEDQLRELLGPAFVRLVTDGLVHRVVVLVAGEEQTVEDVDAGQAYGRALLCLLQSLR